MKRKLYAALGICASASMITACGTSFEAAESTVYVTKQGNVIGADIEDFNEEYYDAEELEAYIAESVENYVALNGDGSIELDRFETKSQDNGVMANMYLNYATYIDYALFNEVEFFDGTIAQAGEEGYEFDQEFQGVEDGSLTGSIDVQGLLEDGELRAVIIGEETTVKIDGTIQAVSDGNAEVTGKNTAQVHYDMEDPDAKPAYILYRQ